MDGLQAKTKTRKGLNVYRKIKTTKYKSPIGTKSTALNYEQRILNNELLSFKTSKIKISCSVFKFTTLNIKQQPSAVFRVFIAIDN